MSEHNPSNLSPSQYGQEQGYRLLEVDEIFEYDSSTPLEEIEALHDGWIPGWFGDTIGATYRTRLSREALAAARGLTPASEPEKADVFDAWMRSEQGRQDLNKIDTSNYRAVMIAAFLAGQRSERNEIESALNKLAKDDVDTGGLGWIGSRELRDIAAWITSREPKGEQ